MFLIRVFVFVPVPLLSLVARAIRLVARVARPQPRPWPWEGNTWQGRPSETLSAQSGDPESRFAESGKHQKPEGTKREVSHKNRRDQPGALWLFPRPRQSCRSVSWCIVRA